MVPIYYDPNYNGETFSAPKVMQGSAVLPFHEFYRKIKGSLPTGRLWDVYRTNLAVDSAMLRLIVMPPGSPKAAVDALRTAVARLNDDKDYADEAMKIIQFVPQYETGAGIGEQVRKRLEVDPGSGRSSPTTSRPRRSEDAHARPQMRYVTVNRVPGDSSEFSPSGWRHRSRVYPIGAQNCASRAGPTYVDPAQDLRSSTLGPQSVGPAAPDGIDVPE